MHTFFVMVSIYDRKKLSTVLKLYQECGIDSNLISLGYGTAVDDTLEYLGLEKTGKVVITSFITFDTWKKLTPLLREKLRIDIPGTGIAFIIPISSVGGKSQLRFLAGSQKFEIMEESSLQNTKYELLIICANIGYSNEVMNAARKARAGGGTVLHAKGTGAQAAESFLGVTLASEKELIYIVVKSSEKNTVMKAVMEEAGLGSKAQAIAFSLPVTSTVGMKFAEFMEQENQETNGTV